MIVYKLLITLTLGTGCALQPQYTAHPKRELTCAEQRFTPNSDMTRMLVRKADACAAIRDLEIARIKAQSVPPNDVERATDRARTALTHESYDNCLQLAVEYMLSVSGCR